MNYYNEVRENGLSKNAIKGILLTFAVIGFVAISIGMALGDVGIGIWACLIVAFMVGGIAYCMPRRDIVALLVPMFGLIIFNPYNEIPTDFPIQIGFMVTIILVSVRLFKRFNSKDFQH